MHKVCSLVEVEIQLRVIELLSAILNVQVTVNAHGGTVESNQVSLLCDTPSMDIIKYLDPKI